MPRIYVGTRRKSSESVDLQTLTVTLPQSVLIELSNYGIESGRGSGNMSGYLENAAVTVVGLFHNPELAKEALQSLVRVDIDTTDTLTALADNLEATAKRIRDSIS